MAARIVVKSFQSDNNGVEHGEGLLYSPHYSKPIPILIDKGGSIIVTTRKEDNVVSVFHVREYLGSNEYRCTLIEHDGVRI